jgi:hypothetical protein
MANAWNEGSWSELGWSGILSSTVEVTAPGNEAWGSLGWGNKSFGGANSLTISQNSVTVDAISLISVTGLQLNTSLNSVEAFGLAIVNVTGQQLNISQGDVDASPDAEVIGQQLNISSPSNVTITAEINSGWGRRGWGIYDWGADSLSVNASLTGQQLNLSLSSLSIIGDANLTLNQLQLLGITEGEVDPSPDANVVGIGMSISLALGTVVIGTANVGVTGQRLNVSESSITVDLNTPVDITPPRRLTITTGIAIAGASAEAPVTGNKLTIGLNNDNINVQIWTVINTGTDATWIEVDTAA